MALDNEWSRLVGRKVRGKIAENEKTQTDAAAVLGLSQPAVNRRLKGEVCFSMAELGRISMWLSIPIGDLLPRQDSNLQPAGYPADYATAA